jgi:GT2 family glycosyltransferase
MQKNSLDISVIIPFKDKAKMTIDCIESFEKYGPQVKEFLLVSNNSDASELDIIRQNIDNKENIKLLEYNHPFNYQKINNWAVKKSNGKLILFLNNDTELNNHSVDLIEKMYEEAIKPGIGMVGCVLLYGDENTIQHAGVYLRPGSLGDHIYVGKSYVKALERTDVTEFPYSLLKDRKVTAVTGAVQLIERRKFDAVKGFDERFLICGGDVDLCIRLNAMGFSSLLVSGGYIIHKESQSRSHKPVPYVDFYYSYISYMKGYDTKLGDPLSPRITENMK